jgi:hypothetical protein
MNKNTRKSTALVSLVLVPLNLLGLGFTAGCDSRDDGGGASGDDGERAEVVDFDYRDPNDVFTLDPVPSFAGGPPATRPTTQPLASSGFAAVPPYHSGHMTHYHRGGGVMFFPVPIPFRPGYRPPYPQAFRAPPIGSPGYRPPYRTGGSSGGFGGSSYSRSSPSRSSGSSHSSSVSRGGFGSSGHASSSS